ncbi:MAG: septation protein A [Methylococcales bacterium]|nr:septation protein A [Methylococcales bacterium]
MKILFDFFPIIVFFIAYRLFGIYAATAVAMIASILQVIVYRIQHKSYDKMHLISFGLIFVLGGATLFFHNPWFIKFKPTGIYWFMAVAILFSMRFSAKPLVQKMMEGNIALPDQIWFRLNLAWAIYFLILGCLNLFVAYHYSTDAWVNFKLFGGAGLTLLFVFVQALYLTKHVNPSTVGWPKSR